MSTKKKKTVDIVADIFGKATVDVLKHSTGTDVIFAPTVLEIPTINLKPDIGCFVQFTGDYSGLMIINFSREAAMEIYRKSMTYAGIPEEELAIDHTADEVVDSIGEMVNQLIGKTRQMIQELYGLSAQNMQPKAICIMDSILLSVNSLTMVRSQCRRLSFRVSEKYSFHIELFTENMEFVLIHPEQVKTKDQHATPDVDFEALVAANAEPPADPPKTSEVDIDALIDQEKAEIETAPAETVPPATPPKTSEVDIDALIDQEKSKS